jgi:hypothetical protein
MFCWPLSTLYPGTRVTIRKRGPSSSPGSSILERWPEAPDELRLS